MKPVMMNSLPVIEACTAPQPSAHLLALQCQHVCPGKLTGVDLVGDPAYSVGNGLKDDDPSEPTVDEVHGVE